MSPKRKTKRTTKLLQKPERSESKTADKKLMRCGMKFYVVIKK